MQSKESFTLLKNSTIGENISMYRKIRGIKAVEIAEKLGLKEAAYTRYERGEGALTIDMVQKIAEILKIDPVQLITTSPANFIDNGHNSPNSIIAFNASNCQTSSNLQLDLLLKLVESVTILNEKVVKMIDNNK